MKLPLTRVLITGMALFLSAQSIVKAQGSNVLWGVTGNGGQHSFGTLFEVSPATSSYTDAYQLDSASGYEIDKGLISYNNVLYGTAAHGGANQFGTLFSYTPATGTFTVLHSFDGASGNKPQCSLLAYNNKLYGTTAAGGSGSVGVLFEYDLATNMYTVLHQFSNATGSIPQGNLVMYNGTIYSTASLGGAHNEGVIFSYDPTTSIYTNVHDFYDDIDYTGKNPIGLAISNDSLWVTCQYGGPGGSQNGYGIVRGYSITSGDMWYQYVFSDNYGEYPDAPPVLYNNHFWGYAPAGGSNMNPNGTMAGVLYAFDPATPSATQTYLHNFDSTLGTYPTGTPLISNNMFYGVSSTGGLGKQGTVFQYNPTADTYAVLHNFDSTTGFNPYGNLALAPAANLAVAAISKPQYTVSLYPNPAQAICNITLTGTPTATFTLTDVAGRTIMQRSITTGSNYISITGLAAGTYLYQVTTKESTQNGKLQIN